MCILGIQQESIKKCFVKAIVADDVSSLEREMNTQISEVKIIPVD